MQKNNVSKKMSKLKKTQSESAYYKKNFNECKYNMKKSWSLIKSFISNSLKNAQTSSLLYGLFLCSNEMSFATFLIIILVAYLKNFKRIL